jgi:peptidase S24-like protein/CI repressor-like protein
MRKTVEEIIETIKALKGFTKDHQVADLLGMGRGALSNAKQRNAFSFFDKVAELCERDNISLDILRRDPFQSSVNLQIANTSGTNEGALYGNFVRVNVFSLTAGDSAEGLTEAEPIDTAIIPRELYNESSFVVQMCGDSMEKLLMHGSNAVIDTSKKNIVSGSLYALKIPHEGNIVRECYSEPQGLSLIPYNKNYPTSRVMWKDFDPDMVIGKVSCSVFNVFR